MSPDPAGLFAIDSEEKYAAVRNDAGFWAPWADLALWQAGLGEAGGWRAPGPSTCPVLISRSGVVVKFFGEHWFGPENHVVETEAHAVVAGRGLPIPPVVARGELLPDRNGWRWPWLAMHEASGLAWSHADAAADRATVLAWARDLGRIVRRFHATPLPATGLLAAGSPAFREMLEERRAVFAGDHRRWAKLAPALIDELERSMPPVPELLAGWPVVLLHGDLHGENIFVDPAAGAVTGLIDFTDVYAGDPRYDLVQLHLKTFRADRELLTVFLDAANWPVGPEFPREMLAFTMLHEFDPLRLVPFDLTGIGSRDELADVLWRVPAAG